MAEKLYTLAEAKLRLAEEQCDTGGHEYRIVESYGEAGPKQLLCERCGRGWNVVSSLPARS